MLTEHKPLMRALRRSHTSSSSPSSSNSSSPSSSSWIHLRSVLLVVASSSSSSVSSSSSPVYNNRWVSSLSTPFLYFFFLEMQIVNCSFLFPLFFLSRSESSFSFFWFGLLTRSEITCPSALYLSYISRILHFSLSFPMAFQSPIVASYICIAL